VIGPTVAITVANENGRKAADSGLTSLGGELAISPTVISAEPPPVPFYSCVVAPSTGEAAAAAWDSRRVISPRLASGRRAAARLTIALEHMKTPPNEGRGTSTGARNS